jgi:hypothetical protein
MPAKRNNIEEESAAEREVAVTRVALACALVLVILFWITSSPPSTEARSVQFSIRGSFGEAMLPHKANANAPRAWRSFAHLWRCRRCLLLRAG